MATPRAEPGSGLGVGAVATPFYSIWPPRRSLGITPRLVKEGDDMNDQWFWPTTRADPVR